jgi:hypothetical protein
MLTSRIMLFISMGIVFVAIINLVAFDKTRQIGVAVAQQNQGIAKRIEATLDRQQILIQNQVKILDGIKITIDNNHDILVNQAKIMDRLSMIIGGKYAK